MNRRGFISMLAGAAGAPLVPWRGLEKALIFLPNATPKINLRDYLTSKNAWFIRTGDRKGMTTFLVDAPQGSPEYIKVNDSVWIPFYGL